MLIPYIRYFGRAPNFLHFSFDQRVRRLDRLSPALSVQLLGRLRYEASTSMPFICELHDFCILLLTNSGQRHLVGLNSDFEGSYRPDSRLASQLCTYRLFALL